MSKLNNIQALRAIAAFMVVLIHANHEIGELSDPSEYLVLPKNLVIGVDIFFVISGFIMVYTTMNTQSGIRASIDFCKKRFYRIVPIYWLYTTLMLLVTIFLGSRLTNPSLDSWHIISSFLFIPALHPSAETFQPLLRVGWTLNFEMFFYIIFALSLLAPKRIRLISASFPILALTAAGIILDPSGVLEFYTRSVILSFFYGMIIGHLYSSGAIKFSNSGLIFTLLSIASYITLNTNDTIQEAGIRGLSLGIPAAFIVMAALTLPEISSTALKLKETLTNLGESSYSLYLNHMFSIGIAKIVISSFEPASAQFIFIGCIITSIFCVLIGHASYILIEKPITKYITPRHERVVSKFSAAGKQA
ncbi:acyltransferase [Pseudomonas stutzeri]|nr:acyltransferase [Stutzerimonas stutzeri]